MSAATVRLGLAWIHLLALAIGVGGVWSRARALRAFVQHADDVRAVQRAYTGDAWWGIAAALWLVTGVWRLFGHTEKNTSYYIGNNAFRLKIALFLVVIALELWPMVTLTRWRRRTAEPNARDARRMEIISYVECALLITIVLAAVSMARGYGATTV